MADIPKVIVPIPPDYWDKPEAERLAVAEELAATITEVLRHG